MRAEWLQDELTNTREQRAKERGYSHDPGRAAERRRNAARGGKAKASGEMGRVKARLQALADMVEGGQMDRADAAVIAVSVELKVREAENLERRMEELEALVAARKERPWGA